MVSPKGQVTFMLGNRPGEVCLYTYHQAIFIYMFFEL